MTVYNVNKICEYIYSITFNKSIIDIDILMDILLPQSIRLYKNNVEIDKVWARLSVL